MTVLSIVHENHCFVPRIAKWCGNVNGCAWMGISSAGMGWRWEEFIRDGDNFVGAGWRWDELLCPCHFLVQTHLVHWPLSRQRDIHTSRRCNNFVLATIDSDLRYGDTNRPHTHRHIQTETQTYIGTDRQIWTKNMHKQIPYKSHICLYFPAAQHHRPLASTHCTYSRRDGQAELTWVVA